MNNILRIISEFQQSNYGKTLNGLLKGMNFFGGGVGGGEKKKKKKIKGNELNVLPTRSEEREVLRVGSIPVAILPSCQYCIIIAQIRI